MIKEAFLTLVDISFHRLIRKRNFHLCRLGCELGKLSLSKPPLSSHPPPLSRHPQGSLPLLIKSALSEGFAVSHFTLLPQVKAGRGHCLPGLTSVSSYVKRQRVEVNVSKIYFSPNAI